MSKPSMNKEIKEKWLTALRSGEYKQCRGSLRKVKGKKESFCCLGVLTDLAIKNNGAYPTWNYFDNNTYSYKNNDVSLHTDIMKWAGFSNISATGDIDIDLNDNIGVDIELSTKNDRGASFKQIANIIEKYIEGI